MVSTLLVGQIISILSVAADAATPKKAMTREQGVRQLIDLAVRQERDGIYPEAIESYEAALKYGGRIGASPALYLRIAECYEKLSQFKNALRYYNEAAGRGAVQWDFYLKRGRTLESLRELARAQEDYERARNLNPLNGDLIGRLGKVKLRQGNAEDALVDLMSAIALLPDEAWIQYEISIALYRLDRTREASEYIRKSLASGFTPPEPEWAAVILSADTSKTQQEHARRARYEL